MLTLRSASRLLPALDVEASSMISTPDGEAEAGRRSALTSRVLQAWFNLGNGYAGRWA